MSFHILGSRNLCSFILTLVTVFLFGAIAIIIAAQTVHAADTVSTSQYLDLDGDGTVDRIRWTMDENVTACTYEAGDWTVNTAGTINISITGLSCTGSDAILDILVSADANETGGATDPVISYSNVGTAGSVTLTSGAMTNKASVTATDGALPRALSATYLDVSGNGTVDRVDVTMTADNGLACTFEAGDWTFPAAGTINLTAATACNVSGNDIQLTVAGTAGTTGGAVNPTVTYTDQGTANQVQDGAGNDAVVSAVTVTDAAGPAALSAVYLDTDTDGVVDRVDVTMSADVGLTCTFEAGDWTFPAAGTINLTAATACAISGNDIRLTVAGDANTTGGAVNPTVTYTDQTTLNQVQDGAGNDVVISAQTATDSAAPLAINTTPANNATGVAGTSNVVVNFTEPMTTAGFTVTITQAVGTQNNVWSNGNATLTVSHSIDFSPNISYNVVIAGTDASPATNALVVGTVPIDWNFNSYLKRSIQHLQSQQEPPTDETPTDETPTDETPTDETDQPTDVDQPDEPQTTFGKSVSGEDVALGSLIKLANSDTLYYVDENGVRHVFVNLSTYQGWYGDDFSNVIDVSEQTIASLPLGSPVTYRPGTMIKIESDPKVYLVVENGEIRHVASESVAFDLFGENWNKQIFDVSVALLFSYNVGERITSPNQVDMNALNSLDISINTEIL